MLKTALDVISNPLIFPIVAAVITSITSGYLTYRFATRKFQQESRFQNKLEHYQILVDKMRSFVSGVQDQTSQQMFIDSFRAIWLFGDTKVIKLLNNFLFHLIDDRKSTPAEKSKKMSNCLQKAVLRMRKDLGTKGKMIEDDIKFYV